MLGVVKPQLQTAACFDEEDVIGTQAHMLAVADFTLPNKAKDLQA